ncbi:MAG: GNAT family N-acetyltransferase [Saprospiraceae bacterium]
MHTQPFTSTAALPYLEHLAQLRIQVFRDFPYLYEGDMGYEMDYLQTYIHAPDSVIVIAFDGEKVVGASTGIPMAFEPENIQLPWREQGYDIDKVFYYGESVLLKGYRGRGIGVQFFEHRERWARQLGRFDIATFCGVVRPDDHPDRPPDFVPLDDFWRKRGFTKTKDLVCYISWLDVNEEQESAKPLHFWYKRIN